MAETAQPTTAPVAQPAQEDVVLGEVLVRFRYRTRVVHWGVALTFLVCLATGLPIWTPLFGWLAGLFGSRSVAGCTPGPGWASRCSRWSSSRPGWGR